MKDHEGLLFIKLIIVFSMLGGCCNNKGSVLDNVYAM